MRRLFLRLAGKDVHTEEVNLSVLRASDALIRASLAEPEEILESLDSGAQGLTDAAARERLAHFGRNEVAHEKAPSWYRQLIQAFFNPFVGILVVLALVSFLTEYVFAPADDKDLIAVVIIGFLVMLSVLLTFFQEYKANRAADRLLSLIRNTSTIERKDSGRRRLVTSDLVPGDIVLLSAGDIIPADVRILSANNLSVNEAVFTGESLPVEKRASLENGSGSFDRDIFLRTARALELPNMGYMGTHVASGTARAVVTATGNRTYFGSMSKELVGHHPATSFDIGIKNVSLLLIRFMAVMVPVIFLVNGFLRGDWFQALLFGAAVAVGLTPEMLPTIVTANLAKGTLEMARRKTVVKRLNAIQNLGAMDVLCTDKTGTLTHDTVAMERCVDIRGVEDPEVLKYTALNSLFQTGLRNPLDEAVLAHHSVKAMGDMEKAYRKVAEIPFETARRRMSVIVEDGAGDHLLICKGAVHEMLSVSDSVAEGPDVVALTDDVRQRIARIADEMNGDGLRVIAVAAKVVEKRNRRYTVDDESGLTLRGLVGFLDPPKETAGPAVKALQRQGIRVCVITGDNRIATKRICREIGLEIEGLLEGHEIDPMSDEMLREAVKSRNVYVRTAPLQKSRILNAIKQNGHTVGFLGDGINDAPALRDADVGISVDNAVDIAKESADIILLEKDLMILEDGVGHGRRVFGNIMKYIKMTVSSNFGNVFSVLVAGIVIPFPPMLPLHLLIQNLLYDVSQISIPWDTVDDEYLLKPRKWNPASIAKFTLYVGPVSSVFDFTTFALLWFVFRANTAESQSLFHTGWFVLGLLSQTMIVHLIRTRKIPFIESTAARPVLVTTGLVMIAGLALPFTPFAPVLGFQALPLTYFPWLFVTLLAYVFAIQAVKTWYIRRFNMWL